VLKSALWGLVQGLTEFLPISSSGHLVLIPALLGVDGPDLATSAILHLGTLAALLWYYRRDLWLVVSAPRAPESRTIVMLLVIGSIPAGIVGLTLETPIEVIFTEPWIVAVSLMITGAVLALASLLPQGERVIAQGTWRDGLMVGVAQAFALLPGISRAGMTITGGLSAGFNPKEAARYAFLLGIPAIGAAGLREMIRLVDRGGFEPELLVGMVVAAVSGYAAIAMFIRLIQRIGLLPFAGYCVLFGGLSYVAL
jgi:undecaprenyl-diphosphatase